MRVTSLLWAVLATVGASCSALHSFHESSPGISDGTWRIGGFVGGIGDTADLSGVDDDVSSAGFDLGMVIGTSSELGVRVTNTDFDTSDVKVVSGGPYLRWYFPGWYGVRPLMELGVGLGSFDYGPGDDTGWTMSVAGGALWLLHDRFGLEALLRQSYGSFENGDDTNVLEVVAGISMFF